ncbi:dynamin family protein [Ilyonectria sp. MPI-CAGE-AT-0026]|nr:dynamin family protein [Ilyonectria sp. MPI-CAGE-AT-0026]
MASENHVYSTALTSPDLLHRIDQLRAKNIGKYLPLPQLVAVGDQSSGKSSLLESLTGIPFPRGQELCTRYATQITHRRDEHLQIVISIIPGPNASFVEKERLELYCKKLGTINELNTEFSAILDEVNELMGIRTANNPTGDKTFTEAILKIEKCGPNENYLTVIDVPGIFRIETEGVTTAKDRVLVERMIKGYIRDSRTIILAVLPCGVDIVTQEILALAEEVDKSGERTLGILTKPDLLKEKSAKAVVCNLVEGKKRPLTLGYYVVRSRGGDDDQNEDAKAYNREEMFEEEPWCTLPSDRLGVCSLRERLQELLGEITVKAFPQLRAETRQKLRQVREELTKLGPSRQSERKQQQYLVGVAGQFQALVRAGLDGDYSSTEAFANNGLRLITIVVNMTEKFNDDFLAFSHTYSFNEDAEEPPIPEEPPTPEVPSVLQVAVELPDSEKNYVGESDNESESGIDSFENPNLDDLSELDDIVTRDMETQKPGKGIMAWISRLHRQSRGLELGTFGPQLLSSAFREQSVSWGTRTEQYLSRIILAIHQFIRTALEEVCADVRVREELMSSIMPALLAGYRHGMKNAMFLLEIEREKKPYTLNHYFNSNLQKSRGIRMRNALEASARTEKNTAFGNLVVDLHIIPFAVSNRSNAEHAAEDLHDILHAYYKVACKRFIDNVYHQSVDHFLLSGPLSPLGVFSEQWVLRLESDKLTAIAGESRPTRDKRERLMKMIEDFEEAVKILRG